MSTFVESSDGDIAPSVSSVHVAPASTYVSPTVRVTWAEPCRVITGAVVSCCCVAAFSSSVSAATTGIQRLHPLSAYVWASCAVIVLVWVITPNA